MASSEDEKVKSFGDTTPTRCAPANLVFRLGRVVCLLYNFCDSYRRIMMVLLMQSIPACVRADVRFNEDSLTTRDCFSTRSHGSFVISLPVSVIVS